MTPVHRAIASRSGQPAISAGADEASSGPITPSGPDIALGDRTGRCQVGSLLFNGSEALRGLQLAAHWTAQGLQIDSVKLQRDDLSLNLSGLLQPTGNWPLKRRRQPDPAGSDAEPWALALKVRRRPARKP